MKTHYIINRRSWLYIVFSVVSNQIYAQQTAFKVSYDVSEYSYYQTHEADEGLLTAQDSIKLAPSWTLTHHADVYFTDSTYINTLDYTYPLGKLEPWMDPVSKIVLTPYSNKVVTEQNKSHSFANAQAHVLQDPKEIAPFYLATDYWQLPFGQQIIQSYQNDGFEIVQNSANTFVAKSHSEVIILDRSNWTETIIEIDPDGTESYRHSKHYAIDKDGYLLLDYEEIHKLDQAYVPCMEFVKLVHYTNIERTFSQAYAPTTANGIYNAQAPVPVVPKINITTDLKTHQLAVVFTDLDPRALNVMIQDSYGNVVLEAQDVTRENSVIDISSLGLGVFTFKVTNHNYQPTKFISN